MLERKIINELNIWKENPNKQCLVVKGARQVGKTTIIEKFAKENYKNVVTINFVETPRLKAIFDGDLSTEEIWRQISIRIPNTELISGETLLFLDEIQLCPNARTALKFLARDERYDVIASGSLLGINYDEVVSFPVGFVDNVQMHSLDFEEFCWAMGMTKTAFGYVKEYFDKKDVVPAATHERMMELFKQYIIIGGMPEVINTFLVTNNYGKVLNVQRNLIEEYKKDIAKYAEGAEKTKARNCFVSIPKQLAKRQKKFQYSIVEKGGNKRKYYGSLMWLLDAGIINMCHNLSTPELPLEGNSKEDEFKVYMADTGLLMSMLEEGSQEDIIDGNLGIYKGAIYENIIADIFTKSGKPLYYFEKNNRLEIDFFLRRERCATAVEVKSGDNTKSQSINTIINHYGVKKAIKLSKKNLFENDTVLSLPLYMACFL